MASYLRGLSCVIWLPTSRSRALIRRFQYRQSYEQQQFIVLVGIIVCTVISSALCSPELTYVMFLGTYLLVGYGDSLTAKLELVRRRVEDYEAVSDEAFTQIAYNDLLTTVEPGAVSVEEVKLSDGMAYLREAAANWRSHLGYSLPRIPGKVSTLALLLALMSRQAANHGDCGGV
jgi:hypothetical protein